MVDKFIEWDRDRLVVAQGTVDSAKARFGMVQILEREVDSKDTLDLVDRLKQIFPAAADRKRAAVAVVFPRQLVTIHRIQLPQVPDSEIADMIRLQASMRLTVPVESVCMDFTPLPVQPGSTTRDVLLVTVPNDQVAIARRTLNDAGLELAEVRVSAYCVAQAVARAGILSDAVSPGKVAVVAVMRRDFIELTFLKGTSVVFSHSGSSWTSADSIERTIRAELTRARMSAAEILGEHTIDRVILIGSPDVTSAVTDQLSARLDGAKIERIDPATAFLSGMLPDGIASADVVTIAGSIIGAGQSNVQVVDLINPRRAPAKKDFRRIKVLAGALAAVLVFTVGFFLRQAKITDLTAARKVLDTENAEIRSELEAGNNELEISEKVETWLSRDIEWLDEFVRLKGILPGTDRLFVDKLTLGTGTQAGVGTVLLEGYARTENDVSELERRIRDAGFGLKEMKPAEARSTAAAQEYAWKIVLEITLPYVTEDSGSKS